ncbi:MAG: PRC-barrel domain-containing protein [Acetobacteraceae bacterium]
MKRTMIPLSIAAGLMAAPWTAVAQQAQPQAQGAATQRQAAGTAGGGAQVATQCLTDLRQLSQKMNQDGFWLSGWRAYGPGYRGVGYAGTGYGAPGAATTPGIPAPGTLANTDRADANQGASPWGNVQWPVPPLTELRTLYAASYVLARNGDQQTCETLVSKTRDAYGRYVSQLQAQGVQPGQITNWRQQRLLAAKPVTAIGAPQRIEGLTGTDVRNPQDQYLGSVEDVVINPDTGKIAYLLVERGGFLGIGEEQIAVPWDAFKATPGMSTLVLNVPEATMEQAPTIESRTFMGGEQFRTYQQQASNFWKTHIQG